MGRDRPLNFNMKPVHKGGDSSDEEEAQIRPEFKEKDRRFRYKRFSDRINEISVVDVFRTTKQVRTEPLPGFTSFFQEALGQWRELNSASHFTQIWSDLHQSSQTMPLLLHYKKHIFDKLLQACTMEAELSLAPILSLLATLARDLQADFLPWIQPLLDRLAALLEEGAEKNAELVDNVFNCVCSLFKHLQKHLAADLTPVLRASSRLRASRTDYVRHFAAEALGFLFRTSSMSAVKTGIRSLLAEAVLRPSEVLVDSAAVVLSESMAGTSNGLHSRASDLLLLVIKADFLQLATSEGGDGEEPAAKRAKGDSAAGVPPSLGEIRLRATAIASRALDGLLNHLRRGKCDDIWAVLLGEARERLSAGATKKGAADRAQSAAHIAFLVAQAVEYIRGSRVEDFAPLFQLTADMLCHPFFKEAQRAAGAAADVPPEEDEDPVVAELRGATFTSQALRLLLAIAEAHGKEVGASKGLTALEKVSGTWAPAFSVPPAGELMVFLQGLLSSHAIAADAGRVFGPHIMAALLRILKEDPAHEPRALVLLLDLCATLQPDPFAGSGPGAPNPIPLLMKCRGSSGELVRMVQKRVGQVFSSPAAELATSLDSAWALARLFPYSISSWSASLGAVGGFLGPLEDCLASTSARQEQGDRTRVLAVLGEVISLQAKIAWAARDASLVAIASHAIELALSHPTSYHILKAAGTAAELLRHMLTVGGKDIETSDVLSESSLLRALSSIGPHLSNVSQPFRRVALQLLSTFDQPLVAHGDEASAPSSSAAERCTTFRDLCSIESSACNLDSGRRAAVLLNAVKARLEYGKLSAPVVPALVHALLGVLSVRFAVLWPPAIDALAAALEFQPAATWPVVFPYLENVQRSFLESKARPPQPQASAEGPELASRFRACVSSGDAAAGGGFTDDMTRLGGILKASQTYEKAWSKAPSSIFEPRSPQWIPVCLAYLQAKESRQGPAAASGPSGALDADSDDESDSGLDEGNEPGRTEGDAPVVTTARPAGAPSSTENAVSMIGGKAWRQQLRLWLEFLSGLTGLKGLYRSRDLQVVVAELLLEPEPMVQQAVLKCLRAFRFKPLNPYIDTMVKMCDIKTLRVVLSTFPIHSEAQDGINSEHRPFVIPFLVRALYPFMKKRTGRIGGKGAPGSSRAAVLNFFAALQPAELVPLLELFLFPMASVFRDPEAAARQAQVPLPSLPSAVEEMAKVALVPFRPWSVYLPCGAEGGLFWREMIDQEALSKLDQRQRVGFIKTVEDLATHLGKKLEPYLPALVAVIFAMIRLSIGADSPGPNAAMLSSLDAKDLRVGGMRLLAELLKRYPDASECWEPSWPDFFALTEGFVERLKAEASAPRPPPILDCAVAIAGDPVLSLIFARKESSDDAPFRMLRACVDVLGSPQSSDPSRDAALQVVEGLLDHPEDVINEVLLPHVTAALEGIRQSVVGMWDNASIALRGRSGSWNLRQLRVLERLAVLCREPETAEALTNALLPLLVSKDNKGRSKARMNEEATSRTLGALAGVWESQGSNIRGSATSEGRSADVFWSYAISLSPLFGSLSSRGSRMSLSRAFSALASGPLPELGTVPDLLGALNAFCESAIEDLDYDRRMTAYARLKEVLWASLEPRLASSILYSCLHDLRNESDLALRHAAAQALNEFTKALERNSELSSCAMKILLPQVKTQLSSSAQAVRQEHLTLLRRLIVCCPGVHPDLAPLVNLDDPEQDFFLNVAHIQLYKRGRALQRLTKLVSTSQLSLAVGSVVGIISPVLEQMVVEGRGGETDVGRELKQAELDKDSNVAEHAIACLGALCSNLPWQQYNQMLNHFLKLLGTKADGVHLRLLVNALCAIVDAFHFGVADKDNVEGAVEDGRGDGDDGRLKAAEDETVLQSLTKRVLPALREHLIVDGKKVRTPVSVAVVKVLKLLPSEVEAVELPRVFQLVGGLLKSRDEHARSDARAAMVRIVCDLGPAYVLPAMRVLRAVLPSRGYTAHVLGYTVHALLAVIRSSCAPGALDESLDEILAVVEADIFSSISEEKEVAAIRSSCKEARKCRSFETFEFAAELCSFERGIDMVLSLLRHHLPDADVPSLRAKVQQLIVHAARGILANKGATVEKLLFFLHDELLAGVEKEEALAAKAVATAGAAYSKHMVAVKEGIKPASIKRNRSTEDAPPSQVSTRGSQMLLELALTVLQASLKKGELGARSRHTEVLQMLDPLVPLVIRALKSRHGPNVSLALRCLSFLVLLPLPNLGQHAPFAGRAATELLKSSVKTTSEVAQDCLKLMAAMLRQCEGYQPTSAQLRLLLTWSFTDIEDAEARGTSFSLLRAVIGRKLVLPEVYDIMTSRIQELLIRSQGVPVRDACSQTLLEYLMDYPLGDKRLQQHLEFLVTNLQGYEFESGRLSAVEFLTTLFTKIPASVLEEHANMFLIPLVTRLVSDASKAVKDAAGKAIQALISRVPSVTGSAFEFVQTWLNSADVRLLKTGVQLGSLLVETQGKKAAQRVFAMLGPVLLQLANLIENGLNAEDWQDVYSTLLFFEKVVVNIPDLLLTPSKAVMEDARQTAAIFWETVSELSLFPHLWVRKSVARLVGWALQEDESREMLLSSEGSVGALALDMLVTLEQAQEDEALADQVVRVLLALTRQFPSSAVGVPKCNEEAEEDGHEHTVGVSLHGLVRRLARMADDKAFVHRTQRSAALKWMAAAASVLPSEQIPLLLPIICRPLYRIVEGSSEAQASEEVASLASEVLDVLRAKLGTDVVLVAYNAARQLVIDSRLQRKRKQATEAMVDPEARAKRKIKQVDRKQLGKKRKIDELKRARSAGAAVKNRRPRGKAH